MFNGLYDWQLDQTPPFPGDVQIHFDYLAFLRKNKRDYILPLAQAKLSDSIKMKGFNLIGGYVDEVS